MFKTRELIKVYNRLFKAKIRFNEFNHDTFYFIIKEGLNSLIKQVKRLSDGEDKIIESDEEFNFWTPYWYYSENIMANLRHEFTKIFYEEQDDDDDGETFISILESTSKWNEEAWKVNKVNKAHQIDNFFSFIWCGLILIIPHQTLGMGKYRYKNYINSLLAKHKILTLVEKLENELNKWSKVYKHNLILGSLLEWIELCFPEDADINLDLDDEDEQSNESSKSKTGNNDSSNEANNKKTKELKDNDTTSNEEGNNEKTIVINQKQNEPKLVLDNNDNNFKFDLNFKSIKNAKTNLTKSIIGQPTAIEKINEILINEMYSSGIKSSRPMGILFFVGPTGVGKTETIKELSKSLYGTDQIHRFDMSEYKSEVAIQKLIGAPNGYAGYDEGGTLTNAMQKNPNAIILFDEIEKADKTVFDLFLQLLDEGFVTSNKGVKSYFKNTIVVFTSNIGASKIANDMKYDSIKEIITNSVEHFFNETINRPEILGRIGKDNIVVFDLISKKEDLFKILDLQFYKFYNEYSCYNFILEYDKDELYTEILKDIDKTKGARDIRNKFDLFKKHLFASFFNNEISKDDLSNLKLKIKYDGKVVKILSKKK